MLAGPWQVALALDPATPVDRYIHQSWGIEQGLPQSSILAITQTRDGYLWLGTQHGLVRFDGRAFKVYDRRSAPEMSSDYVLALGEDPAGNLWVGTLDGGLMRMADGRLECLGIREGIPEKYIGSLRAEPDGTLWVGAGDRQIFRARDNRFSLLEVSAGALRGSVRTIHRDRMGSMWFGTLNGVYQFQDGLLSTYPAAGDVRIGSVSAIWENRSGELWMADGENLFRYRNGGWTLGTKKKNPFPATILAACQDPDGNIWVGTQGAGLARLTDGIVSVFSSREGLTDKIVNTLFVDRENSLWVGTLGGGLNRLKDRRVRMISSKDGLPADFTFSLSEDPEGNIWVGTYGGGLAKLAGGRAVSYSSADGVGGDVIRSVLARRDGSVWIGLHGGGLTRLANGKFTRYGRKNGLPSDHIYALFEDHTGTLWMGTSNGLCRWRDGLDAVYTRRDGLSDDFVRVVLEDSDGALWVGTDGGGLNRMYKGQVTVVTTRDGLTDNRIRSLCLDREGALWIGTSAGLNRLKKGKISRYTRVDGLPDDVICSILEDGRGNLWISSNRGIFCLSRWELAAYAEGNLPSLSPARFGTAEGMNSAECVGGNQPAGIRLRAGQLWFPTIKGVAILDPGHLQRNFLPLPVLIDKVIIDDVENRPAGIHELPPGRRKLEFHYAGLSLAAPEKVRYRYRLDGFDDRWTDAGSRNVAYYSNLPPGDYRFRVLACNSDGIWNWRGAELHFHLQPYIYQTWWFYLFWAAAGTALAFGVHRWRVFRLKARARLLRLQVQEQTGHLQERTRQLEKALAEIKSLRGLLPICSRCKKIRDDGGYWHQVEEYIESRSDAQFTHGICPECIHVLYPEFPSGKKASDPAE